MRVLLFVVLLAVTPRDEKDDVKKAKEKTAALSSYMVQWNEEYTLRGSIRTQGGSSEYVAPDLVTFKSSVLEIVKKKDAAMAKNKEGWVKAEDDPRSKRIAADLKPIHESLPTLLDKVESLKKGKDSDHNKIACRVYNGTLGGDALHEALTSYVTRTNLPARGIDWSNSKLNVEILVNTKEGWIEKISLQGDLKTAGKNASNAPYKRIIEFFNQNKDQPDIVPEVRKALGIEEAKDGMGNGSDK